MTGSVRGAGVGEVRRESGGERICVLGGVRVRLRVRLRVRVRIWVWERSWWCGYG